MLSGRSYSVAELERETGFDRRTIVYYIQQGLIERPGRRGPNTRYPAETLRRLQFIRGVKDLQQRGELLNMTLADIGRAMAAQDAAGLQALLDRGLPVAEVAPLLEAPPPTPSAPGMTSAHPAPTASPPAAAP
ncbi:MAG: helix-turn-helix domain-containing protein, partial [Gammaproteobacteria bacterium]|nr:helix-turn-helix domain-containing protein [Gammaproteobacteria bacterium]